MKLTENINRIKEIMGLLIEQPIKQNPKVGPVKNDDPSEVEKIDNMTYVNQGITPNYKKDGYEPDLNVVEPEPEREKTDLAKIEYKDTEGFPQVDVEPRFDSYGYQVGEYPSCIGKNVICPGGTNGDWDGSLPMVLKIAKYTKLSAGSQKRWKKFTASGNISNHWCGRPYQYGMDLPTYGKQGDDNFNMIKEGLVKDGLLSQEESIKGAWKYNVGKYPSFKSEGFTCQVLWKSDSNHYDHIHIGCKKDSPTISRESEDCQYDDSYALK